jgi:hypothetical protein
MVGRTGRAGLLSKKNTTNILSRNNPYRYYHSGKRGDVVIALYPYEEQNGRAKPRPCVIIKEHGNNEYLLCQITSKNRTGKSHGRWILHDSPEGKQMGIVNDSFINYGKRTILIKKMVFKKIGTYPFIEELI